MKDLSAQKINESSPYKVVHTAKLVMRFITDKALVYEAGFIDDYTFMEGGCFQFYLKEISGSSASRDPKIMQTVGAIIEEFFDKNQSVVLYICDNSDGRQAVRDRIFKGWFDTYKNKDNFTFLHGEANFDDTSYFTSVIIRNDNPDLQDVIDAFNEFKRFILGKYPDVVIR